MDEMEPRDWAAIRADYIQGGGTYRQLAAKWGVPLRTLAEHAKADGWVSLKQQVCDKAASAAVENAAAQKADMETRVQEAAEKMLDRIMAMTGSCKTAKDIRSLTAAIKDIREIAGIRSSLDREEQKARIEALRAKTITDEDDDDTGVIMLPQRMEALDDG